MPSTREIEGKEHVTGYYTPKRDCDDPCKNFERIRVVRPRADGLTYNQHRGTKGRFIACLAHELPVCPCPVCRRGEL